MNEEDFGKARKILLRHDYVAKIRKSGDGCIITYPHPILTPQGREYPQLIECIAIQRGDDAGFWVRTSLDTPKEERFIPLPEYAMRLYIVCEVAACNSRIQLDPALFAFFDEEDNEFEDIEDIILPPERENDRKLESFLYGFVNEARKDGFPPEYGKAAETHNIGTGYESIRKFYIS